MAKKEETLFKERITPKLKSLTNVWYFKSSERSIRGIPDIIMCLNGQFIAMELKKSASATTSKLQDYNLLRIRQCGGRAFLVYPENFDRIFIQLEQISKEGL